MKLLRLAIFWAHLAAGAAAGLVILVMAVTGVALTYEKQLIERADRRAWTAPFSADARHLPPETLLARVAEALPGTAPTGVTLRSRADAPATVTLEGNKALLADPYSGAIVGEPPSGLRSFFRTMTVWHRYLALEGASRATGKLITGAANLTFLFIVASGLYLWLPKVWSWIQFKNVLWFRLGLSGKARDFNWHNVIGVWSAVPLAIVVAGAVPISFSWAGSLVYRLAGDTPPAQSAAAAPQKPATVEIEGLDAAWAQAHRHVPAWRTIATRAAATPGAPVVLTIDEGNSGQPQKRVTITVNRASAGVMKVETFEQLSASRRARRWLRFAHTGEVYGIPGQTIASLTSAGGAVLVYTAGIALALRRFWSWIRRRRTRAEVIDASLAA